MTVIMHTCHFEQDSKINVIYQQSGNAWQKKYSVYIYSGIMKQELSFGCMQVTGISFLLCIIVLLVPSLIVCHTFVFITHYWYHLFITLSVCCVTKK